LGVSLVISALIELVWTSNAVYVQFSPSLSLGDNVSVSVTGLITLIGALCVVTLVAGLLYRTRLGTQIRAVADNPTSALMFGISTRRISLHSYAIALAVSASAGALIAPDISILPNVGQWYLLVGAGVMAIAAFRSLRLAVIGGLIVGVISQLSLLQISSDLQPAIIFVVILAALFMRFWLAKVRARRVQLPDPEGVSRVAN
jgi:branched-subunit amino acid ABC-type transport system permease component